MARTNLLFEERKLWKAGYKKVVGLDEAGRGPLAGPVVAAAVFVGPNATFTPQILSIKDSKQLSPDKREIFFKILTRYPRIEWGIGKVSEKIIDKINIKNAAELAMEKALLALEKKTGKKADFLIIDGNHLNNKKLKFRPHKLIIKADAKIFSCVAASIIAKVSRDRAMRKLHEKFPCYGFLKHKGYPTKQHLRALKKHGPCKIHRKSFRPVKRYSRA